MRIFRYVSNWLYKERAYQMDKWSEDEDDYHTEHGPDYWVSQIQMYLHRAQVLGLENPNGRQALAKSLATMHGFMESVVRVYGELPYPGVSSGNNLDNLMEIK